MKLCPTCQQCYEDAHALCIYDQAALVQARSGTRLIAQKYSLDRLLGSSDIHVVYAGTHLETDRPMAVKLLLPDSVADEAARLRFRREAHAISHLNTRINHHHVIKTYDYGLLSDGTAYVVTELVAGQTLREYMNAAGPLPVDSAIRIARQVADGLDAAHRCGVVHRHIEPEKIILAQDYYGRLEAKIADFGFAKLRKQTATGNGSSPYASPEQCAGHNTDERSDIYGLAVTLYEMLAGRTPSGALMAAGITLNPAEGEQPLLEEFRADVPEALAQLIRQSLHKKPAARPHSAAEVARQLRMIESIPATVPPADHIAAVSADMISDPAINPQSSSDQDAPHVSISVVDLHSQEDDSKTDSASPTPIEGSSAATEPRDDLSSDFTADGVEHETILEQLMPLSAPTPRVAVRPDADAGVKASAYADPNVPGAPHMHRHYFLMYTSLVVIALALGTVSGLWLGISFPWSSEADSTQSLTKGIHAPEQARSALGNDEESFPLAAANSSPLEIENSPSARMKGLPIAQSETTPPAKSEREFLHATRDQKSEMALSADDAVNSRETDSGAPQSTPVRPQYDSTDARINIAQATPVPAQNQSNRACALAVSESLLTLRSNGGSAVITVSLDGQRGSAGITFINSSWSDILVFPETPAVKSGDSIRYSIVSTSKAAGTYAIIFKSSCGSKKVMVTVK